MPPCRPILGLSGLALLLLAGAAPAQGPGGALPAEVGPPPAVFPQGQFPSPLDRQPLAPAATLEACPPVGVVEARPPLFWAQLDYLYWWYKQGAVNQPLVTTTSADLLGGQRFVPQVLFGNQELGTGGPRSGLRLAVGGATGDGWWVEGRGLLLERDLTVYRNDPASVLGQAPLARPFRDASTGAENQNVLNLGPVAAGSIAIRSYTKLWGAEANVGMRTAFAPVESLFVGYRFLGLREGLNINDRSTSQTGGLGFFGGLPVNEGETRVKVDDFTTRNDFHGAQLGARTVLRRGAFDATLRTAVALGFTNQTLTVAGSTTRIQPENVRTPLPGGLLALPSNGGARSRSSFAVLPEVDLSLGCQVFDHLRVGVGYNFLYCSSVVRPGDQVERSLTLSQVPISPTYNPGAAAVFPRPQFRQGDFWAHGLSFEMLFSF